MDNATLSIDFFVTVMNKNIFSLVDKRFSYV